MVKSRDLFKGYAYPLSKSQGRLNRKWGGKDEA